MALCGGAYAASCVLLLLSDLLVLCWCRLPFEFGNDPLVPGFSTDLSLFSSFFYPSLWNFSALFRLMNDDVAFCSSLPVCLFLATRHVPLFSRDAVPLLLSTV